MELLKKSHWQSWMWHLFTSHRVVYLESSFTNVENYFRKGLRTTVLDITMIMFVVELEALLFLYYCTCELYSNVTLLGNKMRVHVLGKKTCSP